MGLVHTVVLSAVLAGALCGWIAPWPSSYPSGCIHSTLARQLASLQERLLSTRNGSADLMHQNTAVTRMSEVGRRCRDQSRGAGNRLKRLTLGCGPTRACSPTPLRGPKIGGILQTGFVLTRKPIYRAARLMRRPLGGASILYHISVHEGGTISVSVVSLSYTEQSRLWLLPANPP
jgi:hypothetical protein